MGDYPDPDEEYEMMYADELEMLNEDEDLAGKTDIFSLQRTHVLN